MLHAAVAGQAPRFMARKAQTAILFAKHLRNYSGTRKSKRNLEASNSNRHEERQRTRRRRRVSKSFDKVGTKFVESQYKDHRGRCVKVKKSNKMWVTVGPILTQRRPTVSP